MTSIRTGRLPKASYVVQRGSIWHYHREVPEDLRAKVGKSVWKKSLKTGYKSEALSKAHELAVEHDALIARLREPDPLDTLSPEARARIADAGGVAGYARWLESRVRDAQHLESQAKATLDAANGEPIDLDGWLIAPQPSPDDPEPDPDNARAQAAGMDAERRAILAHIAREAPTLRHLNLPDLTKNHPELAESLASTPAPSPSDDTTLSALIDAWERQKQPRESTQYRYPLGLFIEEFGDLPLKTINKGHVRAFRDMLPKLARASGARGEKGKSLGTLRKLAKSGAPLLARTTAAKYLRALGTLLRFAVDEGYIDLDPAAGIKPQSANDKATPTPERSRRSLTPDEIKKLLSAADTLIATGVLGKIDIGWFVRLLTYTGARGEEVAQLAAPDIVATGEHPHIRIHGEDGKLIKNAPSWRVVPVHPALLALGFLDFVKARSNGETLWRTLPVDSRKRRYSKMSRQLRDLLRAEGIKDDSPEGRKVVAHSWRHSFKDAARAAEVPEEIAERLQGHKSPDRATARGYGDAQQLQLLAKWIAVIDPLDPARKATEFEDDDLE